MPDREGVVSVVKLRTTKGTLLWPIKKQKYELDVLKKTDATEKEKTHNGKSKTINFKTQCGQSLHLKHCIKKWLVPWELKELKHCNFIMNYKLM